jgi:hypothetical protein
VDGNEMEAVLAIGTMFASHENQLGGIDACSFLQWCVWEFDGALGSKPSKLTAAAEALVKAHKILPIPYLGPINDKLPTVLTSIPQVAAGNLQQPRNLEEVDLIFGSDLGSGESKDRGRASSLLELVSRVPQKSKLHLIVCQKCPGTPQTQTVETLDTKYAHITVCKVVATDGQLDLVEIYKSKATAKEKQTKNTLVIFVEMQQVRCLS